MDDGSQWFTDVRKAQSPEESDAGSDSAEAAAANSNSLSRKTSNSDQLQTPLRKEMLGMLGTSPVFTSLSHHWKLTGISCWCAAGGSWRGGGHGSCCQL